MKSCEKIVAALSHQNVGHLAFDIGATKATGIHASLLYRLRKLHGRDEPVKIADPFMMLGLVDEKDTRMFGLDLVGVGSDITCFGYRNKNWKSWTLPDGTPALVGERFTATVDSNGDTFLYPQGDASAPPSGKLPANGYYFDQLPRQQEFDENNLNAIEDYKDQFTLYTEETLRLYEEGVNYYSENTDLGIVLNTEAASFGAHTQIIAPMLRNPTGIRDLPDWLMAHLLYPDYVHDVLRFQCEINIKNLKLLQEAVGNKPHVVFISSTDFGTQRELMMSREVIVNFYMPYYKKIADWIHENTKWKTLIHCCGAILPIIGDMCDSGIDCLNPIQCNASGMDPEGLQEKFGDNLVFWGGLVDGQTTLAHGTPQDVEKQIHERINILGKKGGLVAAVVHNVQPTVPIENITRVLDVMKTYR